MGIQACVCSASQRDCNDPGQFTAYSSLSMSERHTHEHWACTMANQGMLLRSSSANSLLMQECADTFNPRVTIDAHDASPPVNDARLQRVPIPISELHTVILLHRRSKEPRRQLWADFGSPKRVRNVDQNKRQVAQRLAKAGHEAGCGELFLIRRKIRKRLESS